MNHTIYAAGRLQMLRGLKGHSPESPPPGTFISLERNLRAPVFQDIYLEMYMWQRTGAMR